MSFGHPCHLHPGFVVKGPFVSEFLLHKGFGIDDIRPFKYPFPVFADFLYVEGNLVSARAAVVNDAFFKQGVRPVHDQLPEFRGYHSPVPTEIYVLDIDAACSRAIVNREGAFVEEAVETFESREELLQAWRQFFQYIDGLGASYREEDYAADAASAEMEFLYEIIHAHAEGGAGSEDVANCHHPVPGRAEFFVLDFQTFDLMVLYDSLA